MRSKAMITDYTLSNDFDLFCTFTFDPEKADSFDFELCKEKMQNWLSNSRRDSPDLKYLIVAEKHKTGRIHFHALMKYYNGVLTPAFSETGKQKEKNGRKIYNMGQYNWGWSTAIKIDNIEKVASYVQKYITKDMLKIGNKKRFWASRNLQKPTKQYNINLQEEIYTRPLFILGTHREEYYKIYRVLKG